MLHRTEEQYRSQITFTSDFHELVTGNLKPGSTVRLSYDPQRIVPTGDPYVFGDPQRPVTVHVRFGPASPTVISELTSPGIAANPDRDATGQGSMLKTNIEIPPDRQMLSLWFSFVDSKGAVVYDSDFGVNFNFRFPENDLQIISTNVVADPAEQVGRFSLQLSTTPEVDATSVRFCPVGRPRTDGQELPLRQIDGGSENRKQWMLEGVVVPLEKVISFKVFYWIGGVRFKDDNTGHYYLSPPRPAERIPPPPPELSRPALPWK